MKNLAALTRTLQQKVPNAQLTVQSLPQAPQIELALIEDTYPQHQLTAEQVEFLMDEPPYWGFCWASGQVLANYLLANPSLVAGKTAVDFGSGSGVVAIAAKMAGADKSIALDIDAIAQLACQTNAEINQVKIEIEASLEPLELDTSECVLLIADVFYDEANIPLLEGFLKRYETVVVADSRVKPSALSGVSEIARFASSTVPDLGESADFNSVGIYMPSV